MDQSWRTELNWETHIAIFMNLRTIINYHKSNSSVSQLLFNSHTCFFPFCFCFFFFTSLCLFFSKISKAMYVYHVEGEVTRRKENALIITFRPLPSFCHIQRNVFQFSLLHATSCRERMYVRTNERESELYIGLVSSLPPTSCVVRCLRKNQVYPAISIELHAKISTLYCYHRHIYIL